ncbi:MAG: hypothetical protein K2K28_02495 [Clostridia bacterium]|nr:hypothetical protein [Clostridia bacterium]
MKKLLTIVVCGGILGELAETAPDEVEFLYTENNEADLPSVLKQAKGKYIYLLPSGFALTDLHIMVRVLSDKDTDLVSFANGAAAKNSLFKGLNFKDNNCAFLFGVFSALEAKTLTKTQYSPVCKSGDGALFNADANEGILIACTEFKKVKAKLTKEIYAYVSDMLIAKLTEFYMLAILAIRGGNYTADKLLEFDAILKGEIVLYLALEKHFPVTRLEKLREKKFKISVFTAKKLKKYFTKKDA